MLKDTERLQHSFRETPRDARGIRGGPPRSGAACDTLPVEAEAEVALGLPAASVDRLRGEDLPAGWRWCTATQCSAVNADSDYAQITSGRDRYHAGEIPPAVWSAVEARALRLGLVAA